MFIHKYYTLIRPVAIIAAVLWLNNRAVSQQNDAARIALHTVISEKMLAKFPSQCRRILESKLGQIATQNGMGGFSPTPKFIITASVIVLEKNVAPTTPPMMTASLDVTLFIADAETKTSFQSVNLQLKGAGNNDNAALTDALQKLSPANAVIKQFVAEGKNKIIQYYESQCDFIITEAMALSSQSKYLESITKLATVPNVSTGCYTKVMAAIGPVYQKYIDVTCMQKLQAASMAWNGNQNSEGANMAREILQSIDPQAACIQNVITFSDSIRVKLARDEKKQWDFKVNVSNAMVSNEKIMVSAFQAIKETSSSEKDIVSAVPDPDDWLF
ncbi:MAG: hypothetical protein NW207_12550 [Cytophagales bacterium]|nr:hypothetical protein [Cytophagales bacterium]